MGKIVLENVTKTFEDVVAVDNLSLTIESGEFFSLLGPSGCGKTTTMRLIAGLETPDKGKIWIDDKIVFDSEKNIDISPDKRGLGMVFQNYALWPHMTVRENVVFGLNIRKIPEAEQKKRLDDVFELLEIEGMEERYPNELSGGQQQRVALARELVTDGDILLMDEPLSNLDARLRISMRLQLKQLHKKTGGTIIYVTHDQIEALTLSTKMSVMKEGKVQQTDGPRKIFVHPDNLFVASFMGDNPINTYEAEIKNKKVLFNDLELPIPDYYNVKKDEEKVILGVRPEELSITDENDEWCIPGTVDSVLSMGYEEIVYVKINSKKDIYINVMHDSRKKIVESGMDVYLKFDPETFHLFNKNDKKRLEHYPDTKLVF